VLVTLFSRPQHVRVHGQTSLPNLITDSMATVAVTKLPSLFMA